MFEALEPAEEIVPRRWPFLMNGTYGLVGLVFVLLVVRRHGLSQPVTLAIACAMCALSLTWLVTTLRSGSSLTNRKLRLRNIIMLVLIGAIQVLSLSRY
jgi:hypothetical protein